MILTNDITFSLPNEENFEITFKGTNKSIGFEFYNFSNYAVECGIVG